MRSALAELREIYTAAGYPVYEVSALCGTGLDAVAQAIAGRTVLFSGHILCADHFTRKGDPVRIAAIQSLMVCVVSAVLAFITEEPSWEKIVSAAVPILYCGVVSAGAGYTLQLVGQKYTDPTIASLLMSLESVFAVIAGSVLLKERMTTREAMGCVIMFAAILLVQIPVKGKGKKAHG